jgi:hypothetical protein
VASIALHHRPGATPTLAKLPAPRACGSFHPRSCLGALRVYYFLGVSAFHAAVTVDRIIRTLDDCKQFWHSMPHVHKNGLAIQ